MKKIVCLHGYSMNSAWLQSWLEPIQLHLGSDYQLLYPQGPIECPAEEVRAMMARFNMPLPEERIGRGKNWCWYRADEQKPPTYHQIEVALGFLSDYFSRHRPVDGVIGWSQGAVMTALLASLRENEPDDHFDFSWAILCGGFLPGDRRYRPLFEAPLAIPTLHVTGEKESDFMKQQSEKMRAAFINAERLDTPCGHIMPVKSPQHMNAIAEWIMRQP